MKLRIFAAAFAAFVLASCTSKPGDVTKITGVVTDQDVTSARITLAQDVDTTVNVVDGKFYVEIPASVDKYGMIMLMVDKQGKYGTYYVSDGTELTVTLDGDQMKLSSSTDYVASAYAAYVDEVTAIYKAEAETMNTDLEAIWFETVKANPDNAIATLVVSDAMYDLDPEKMLELISYIQEPVKSGRFIASREKEATAQLNTKPGMMFTDFTVEHVYGYDRSMDPKPLKKEVKFSDYVGKGTYVLVDFWSPWCGPCKRVIPNIKKVYEQYKGKGLEVLSIAVWERKPQSHTIETAAELGMDWLHINNAQAIPTDIYGIGGIPHLMLIGPDGTILERGFHGLEGIEAAVAKHIN